MSYYIRGNKTRGAEVIKLLESKGGKNTHNLDGCVDYLLYFINKDSIICNYPKEDKSTVNLFCKELTLPEKWEPKFKVGDTVKTNNIIGNILKIDYSDHTYQLTTNGYWCSEEELKLYEWTPKRGETILVKAGASCEWEEAVYSYSTEHSYHTVGGESWNKIYCIPFDLNKLGKITED